MARVARDAPTRSGSSAAAAGGNAASRISGRPNVALSVAMMSSHASASSKPPPRQRPSTSAAVGAGNASSRLKTRCVSGSTVGHHLGHVFLDARAVGELAAAAFNGEPLDAGLRFERMDRRAERAHQLERQQVAARARAGRVAARRRRARRWRSTSAAHCTKHARIHRRRIARKAAAHIDGGLVVDHLHVRDPRHVDREGLLLRRIELRDHRERPVVLVRRRATWRGCRPHRGGRRSQSVRRRQSRFRAPPP